MQPASDGQVPDCPTIIIGRWDLRALTERSLALPLALFISSSSRSVARAGNVVMLSRGPIKLLAVVFGRLAHFIPYDEIIDVMWGDDIDGGPDNPRGIISQYLADIDLIGPSLGLRIERRHSFGMRGMVTNKAVHTAKSGLNERKCRV